MVQPSHQARVSPPLVPPQATGQAGKQPSGAPDRDLGRPGLSAADTPRPTSRAERSAEGLFDKFLERRFRGAAALDLKKLSADGIISFLSSPRQVDRYYEVPQNNAGLAPGNYRIRDEGGPVPLVTLKRHAKQHGEFSETLDVPKPSEALLAQIESLGTLIAVIDKQRQTFKSKSVPNCLLHRDEVLGLGEFWDVKADTPKDLAQFLGELGLSDEPPVESSYLAMKLAKGVKPFQLKVWEFHTKFEHYIQGLVSGTLTPLTFLTGTAFGGGSKTAMVIALVLSGIGDGMSDSVAASQTTQSQTGATWRDQAAAFCKTLAGKVAVPLSFLPLVFMTDSVSSLTFTASAWAAVVLGVTASIQSIAIERSVTLGAAKLLGWGSLAVGVGASVGHFVPPLIERLLR